MDVIRLACISILACVGASPPEHTSDFIALRRVLSSQGKEYLRLRDQILDISDASWDVSQAANESWELGVAAFVLNARRAAPGDFKRMDGQEPRLYANLTWYAIRTKSIEHHVAFLLEKVWKPVGSEDKRRALNDLGLSMGSSVVGIGHVDMWLSIWEQCTNEGLREFALFLLSSSSDANALDIVEEVLTETDESTIRLKSISLLGLRSASSDAAVDIIMNSWQTFQRHLGLRETALGTLGFYGSTRARHFVYDVALDQDMDDSTRAAAMGACCIQPHSTDSDMFVQFIRQAGSEKLKAKGLHALQRCPLENVRAAVHEAVRIPSDSKVLQVATLILNSGYIRAKQVEERAADEDIALLRGILAREDLPRATRFHVSRYIQRIEDTLVHMRKIRSE